jgi:hypothetical protein
MSRNSITVLIYHRRVSLDVFIAQRVPLYCKKHFAVFLLFSPNIGNKPVTSEQKGVTNLDTLRNTQS